ncbi:MAG: hypothetical protein AAF614_06930 [Chloroflexota bacterium]
MSWFNTLVNTANLAASLSQYEKLASMNALQEQAALVNQMQAVMKEYLFQVNQTLKGLVAYADTEPLPAVVGLYLLEVDLKESGLNTSMFVDFSDKEIFSTIKQNLADSRARVFEALGSELQEKADEVIDALYGIQDLKYVVANHKNAMVLKRAMKELESLAANKPGLLAFSAQKRWNQKYRAATKTVNRFQPHVDLKRYSDLSYKYYKFSPMSENERFAGYQQRLADFESLIQDTFKTYSLPAMIDPRQRQIAGFVDKLSNSRFQSNPCASWEMSCVRVSELQE